MMEQDLSLVFGKILKENSGIFAEEPFSFLLRAVGVSLEEIASYSVEEMAELVVIFGQIPFYAADLQPGEEVIREIEGKKVSVSRARVVPPNQPPDSSHHLVGAADMLFSYLRESYSSSQTRTEENANL